MAVGVQIPSVNDSRIQWKDANSKNGRPFRIGVLKGNDALEEKGEVAEGQSTIMLAAKANYKVDIDWPVDNTGHKTSDDFKATTGISAYKNAEEDGAIYKYTLYVLHKHRNLRLRFLG